MTGFSDIVKAEQKKLKKQVKAEKKQQKKEAKAIKEPGFIRKTGYFFAACGSATAKAAVLARLRVLGHFARKYELAHLKATDPKMAEHLGLRFEAAKMARKAAQIGPGHKKTIEYLLMSHLILVALEKSTPDEMPGDEIAATEACRGDLVRQIDRLTRDLPSKWLDALDSNLHAILAETQPAQG